MEVQSGVCIAEMAEGKKKGFLNEVVRLVGGLRLHWTGTQG